MDIVVFGEVLWDIKGTEHHIGGAPFNFAAHLRKLGHSPKMITAIGQDSLGTDTLAVARRLGFSKEDFALTDKPTGSCQVTESSGSGPVYHLVQDVAYDYIPLPDRLPDAKESILYFGSLAQRAPHSARTLANLLCLPFAEVFCDVNLRTPFFNREILHRCLCGCTTLKVSREEYETLGDLNLVNVTDRSDYEHSFCECVCKAFPNIRRVILTLDRDGAMVYESKTHEFFDSVRPTSKAVSTVGAGDSFSACFVSSLLRGYTVQQALNRAVKLSDFVVTREGAVPDYPADLAAELNR